MTDTDPTEQDPLQEIQQANAELIQTAMRRGVRLDPIVQIKIRLDVLTEFVLGEAPRYQYEHAYEQTLQEYLHQAIEQANPTLVIPNGGM